MSKQHVHLQNMNKTSAKFQNDQAKIVGGVALTKYPLLASEMPKNDLSSQVDFFSTNVQTACTSSDHEQNISKVSKTVGGVALTKYPFIVSTDGLTNLKSLSTFVGRQIYIARLRHELEIPSAIHRIYAMPSIGLAANCDM